MLKGILKPHYTQKHTYGAYSTLFHRTHPLHTLLFKPAPLLDKAHEGGDSCPRANHDHWVAGFKRQAELRLADVHGNSGLVAVVSDQLVLQPVGSNSLVIAAGLGFVLYHNSTDVDAIGVNLWNNKGLQTAPILRASVNAFISCLLPYQRTFFGGGAMLLRDKPYSRFI